MIIIIIIILIVFFIITLIQNLKIIKNQLKEPHKESSLTSNELEDVRDFCRLILNSHNSGVYKNKDFTENRNNYCCNPCK